MINENRAYFRHLFKYAIWFATNELPTRGHDETEDSNNPGNWLSFIKLQMEMNPSFSELHGKMLKNSHHTFDYTSKTSLNGFFEVIADSIRQKICEEIRECGMLCNGPQEILCMGIINVEFDLTRFAVEALGPTAPPCKLLNLRPSQK